MSGLKDKLPIVLYAGAIAAAGLAADSATRAVFARQRPRAGEALREVRARPGGGNGPVSIDRYAAVRPERFCGLPSPAPPPAPAPPPENRPSPAQPEPPAGPPKTIYLLRGTLAATNPELSRAFIEIPGVVEQQAYRIGDSVQGAKVLAIGKDSAEIEVDGLKVVLTVEYDFGSGSPAPPAADGARPAADAARPAADGARPGMSEEKRRLRTGQRSQAAREEARKRAAVKGLIQDIGKSVGDLVEPPRPDAKAAPAKTAPKERAPRARAKTGRPRAAEPAE